LRHRLSRHDIAVPALALGRRRSSASGVEPLTQIANRLLSFRQQPVQRHGLGRRWRVRPVNGGESFPRGVAVAGCGVDPVQLGRLIA
jgi:hypothetical protein